MERNFTLGRKALAKKVAYAAKGCGPARTVGVPTTTVAASTRDMASLPISVTGRENNSTLTPFSTRADAR